MLPAAPMTTAPVDARARNVRREMVDVMSTSPYRIGGVRFTSAAYDRPKNHSAVAIIRRTMIRGIVLDRICNSHE
jgi:hypothetical protein